MFKSFNDGVSRIQSHLVTGAICFITGHAFAIMILIDGIDRMESYAPETVLNMCKTHIATCMGLPRVSEVGVALAMESNGQRQLGIGKDAQLAPPDDSIVNPYAN